MTSLTDAMEMFGHHHDLAVSRIRHQVALMDERRRRRGAPPVDQYVIEDAAELLAAMLDTGSTHGITAEDWAAVTGLPAACLGVIVNKRDGGRS